VVVEAFLTEILVISILVERLSDVSLSRGLATLTILKLHKSFKYLYKAMQFACNSNRERIQPSYSGERGICPICDNELIGKCGDILIWHWQHSRKSNCDPWKESETEWHRNWKGMFPEDWREVVIEKGGQKHRADILTADGTVIEFQNSSILGSTIQDREIFYNKMVWVVNAESFKSNFRYYSIVKAKLNSLSNNWDYEVKSMEEEYREVLTEMHEDLKSIEAIVSTKFKSIDYKKELIENLEELAESFEESVSELIAKWDKSETYWNDIYFNVITTWQSENRSEYISRKESIKKQLLEIETHEKLIAEVKNLDEFYYEEVTYKIIPYERIGIQTFFRFKSVKRETMNSLLPVVLELTDVSTFDSYKFSKDKYIFITDPQWIYEKRFQAISDIKNKIAIEENALIQFIKVKKDALKENIMKAKSELEKQVESIYSEIWPLQAKVNQLESNIKAFKAEKEKEVEDYKNEQYQADDRIRAEIMKEYKGLYGFTWKHERRSWKEARKTIYFDIGEDYLFKLQYEDQVQKISKAEFISKYKG
jgi:competence CoiA-like predicted nuclease